MSNVHRLNIPAAQPNVASGLIDQLSAIIAVQTEIAAARLELDGIMQLVCARAQELAHADGGIVELADGTDMVYRAATGLAASHLGTRMDSTHSLSGLCVRTGQVLRCDDSETDPRVDREACRRVGLRSMIVVPLVHQGQSVGVLKVMAAQPNGFDNSDAHTLQLLAGLIGSAMGNASKHETQEDMLKALEANNRKLEEMATTDGLTGLANRRHFDDALRMAHAAQFRSGHPLSLLMIDVDKFKSYNDTYGHQGGDDILQQVGRTLRQTVRAHELVARYGGEEFAVILPGAGPQEAMGLAERLRAAIESANWPQRAVTISLGAATSTDATCDPEELVHTADAALYQSKADGRNRATHKTCGQPASA